MNIMKYVRLTETNLKCMQVLFNKVTMILDRTSLVSEVETKQTLIIPVTVYEKEAIHEGIITIKYCYPIPRNQGRFINNKYRSVILYKFKHHLLGVEY